MRGINSGEDLVAPQRITTLPTPLAVTLRATRPLLQESHWINPAYFLLNHHLPHELHTSLTAILPEPSPLLTPPAIAVAVAIQTPKDHGHPNLKMLSHLLHRCRL